MVNKLKVITETFDWLTDQTALTLIVYLETEDVVLKKEYLKQLAELAARANFNYRELENLKK